MLTRIALLSSRHTCRRYYASRPKYNSEIVNLLKSEVAEELANPEPNASRAKTLRNAIRIISTLDFEITDPNAIKDLKGIGRGVMRRVREHLLGNKPEDMSEEQRYLLELESVPQIGRRRAEKLVQEGCRGIAGVREERFWNTLTEGQQASIRFAEHLDKKFTLQEADAIINFIRDYYKELKPVAVGEWRRKVSDTKAISVLLTDPSVSYVLEPPLPRKGTHVPASRDLGTPIQRRTAPLHRTLIPKLKDRGLLVAATSTGLHHWSGIAVIPEKNQQGKWSSRERLLNAIKNDTGEFRRLHIYMAPAQSEGAALIYRTGDETFRRRVKQQADALGLYLNELGLWQWHASEKESPSPDEKALSTGFWHMLDSKTEMAVFEQLGMQYVEPQRRNLSNI